MFACGVLIYQCTPALSTSQFCARRVLIGPFIHQRFPDRESHGLATEDKAGLETTGDTNAMLYYHRVGTPQCTDNFEVISVRSGI